MSSGKQRSQHGGGGSGGNTGPLSRSVASPGVRGLGGGSAGGSGGGTAPLLGASSTGASSALAAGAAASLSSVGGGRNAPFNLSGHAATHDTEESFNLKSKLSLLEKDLERRQESYISRERAYKTRIEELEEELSRQKQRKSGWVSTDSKLSVLKQMQTQIVENVELVQDRTAHILQEQERDLLRAFRARLFDVQTELDKERGRKDDGAAQWIERCRQLEAEVEWAKEVADRLERVNQNLVAEAARLKTQFANQEEDRNHLVKQLVAIKRTNAAMKSEHAALKDEYDLLKTQLRSIQEGGGASTGMVTSTGRMVGGGAGGMEASAGSVRAENEERLKEANARLRRLLAEERRSLQQVRQNYATELKSRTEMELLLRNCVEDVRHEIARRKLEDAVVQKRPSSRSSALPPVGVSNADASSPLALGQEAFGKMYGAGKVSAGAASIPVDSFAKADRDRVLELLLSQERVVSLLYAKTFPVGGKPGASLGANAGAIGAAGQLHPADSAASLPPQQQQLLESASASILQKVGGNAPEGSEM